MRIEIAESTPPEVLRALERHEADLAVTCEPFGDFAAKVLACDRLMLALPPALAPLKGRTLSLKELPCTLILNQAAAATLRDFLPRSRLPQPDNCLMVQAADSALQLTRDGLGAALISKFVLDAQQEPLPAAELEEKVEFKIGLLSAALKPQPAAAAFLAAAEKLTSARAEA